MTDTRDFGGEYSQEYKANCSCGKEFNISTQEDIHPEYYTDIFVKCDCGESVKFILPVN